MSLPALGGREGEAVRRLRRLGFDSERSHLRVFLGPGRTDLRAYRRALAGLAHPAGGPRRRAWALALRGRGLSELGDFKAASAALERAARQLPDSACVRAWRGELALLSGASGAAAELEASIRLDPQGYPWAHLYLAALHCRLGRLDEAERALERFSALRPASAGADALKAVVEAQRGRTEKARGLIDRAAGRGRAAWVRGLRGSLRLGWGDLEGARADLSRALRAEPAPWLLARRAEALNRLGFYWSALRDLKRASAALPSSPEPWVQAAAIHMEQAQYGRAVEKLSRALRLRPRDPMILSRRSKAHFVQGDLAAARRDAEGAWRLRPRDAALAEERAKLAVLAEGEAEAERALGTLGGPALSFWRGYLRCRQRRFEEARKLFRAAARGLDGELAERAAFYAACARFLARPAQAPASRGEELFIIGLGHRHPFQLSLGALDALRRCEVFYSNLSDDRVADFLGLFPVPCRPIVFRRADQQANPAASAAIAGFKEFSKVGLVTRANPLVYGRLAWRVLELAERRGAACVVPSSVSVFEAAPCLAADLGGEALGCEVRNMKSIDRPWDRRLPLVVYWPKADADWPRLPALLARVYAPSQPCWLLPGAGSGEFSPERLSLAGLGEALAAADPAVTLYVPEARA